MSNAIIRQTGAGSVVADNIWQLRLGPATFVLGLLAGAAALALARRATGGAARPRPATPTGWPVCFAHRGGADVVPENTIEGFREGLRMAGDAVVELDVHATADGAVVVLHDADVRRTTDGSGLVAEMTLAEVQRLDAGYRHTTDGGATHPWRGRGVRVPTLAAVYAAFPDHPVNIELKGTRPGLEQLVADVVEQAGAQTRTLVVANSRSAVERFRSASRGTVATGASVGEFVAFWLLSLARLGDLYRVPFQALQPPERFKGVRVVTPYLVRQAHRRGLRVDVWTIDDEPAMRRLLAVGVDGIMTDRPDLLGRLLGTAADR